MEVIKWIACVFSMRSKHTTVAKAEHLSRSIRTFQPLASAGRIIERFWSRSIFRHAGRPKRASAAQSELGRVARLTTVGAMAGTIAHELNQPLAAIVSNGSAGLRWLDRPEPNLEEARLAFERVVSEGRRAAHIITGIRAMFRKDSGDSSPVAVNELVCDVDSTSLGELKSRRVSLALQLLDDLSAVQADRVQLQHVLLNLFTNAVDSMASVTDRPDMLCVRSEHLEGWVVISVQDSGTGIAPEHAERMFNAFFTTKPNGIGLGLSICRSIVESHGGQLSVFPAHPHG